MYNIRSYRFYSLFNYLATVVDIFVTIYNCRAHNYFITIVMKFRNYFSRSTHKSKVIKWLFSELQTSRVGVSFDTNCFNLVSIRFSYATRLDSSWEPLTSALLGSLSTFDEQGRSQVLYLEGPSGSQGRPSKNLIIAKYTYS